MFRILVILQVRDFDQFEAFEHKAAAIMSDHEGIIALAFESRRNADGSGEEIHLLEFKSRQHFLDYRQDKRHSELGDLRLKSISNTEIKEQITEKFYTTA